LSQLPSQRRRAKIHFIIMKEHNNKKTPKKKEVEVKKKT
jgi:hypothetical protein